MVSVIIPIYNAEEHLRRGLDSVLGQDTAELEAICIDDGSTDASGAIVEEYARRDGRVKLVRQENSGQGAARNRGLEYATGEYVYFMDADDELARPDALRILSAEMSKERLDALFFDADTRIDPGVKVPPDVVNPKDYMRSGDYSGVFSGTELLSRFLRNNEYCVSPCLLMLRRGFVEECAIRFPAERIFYEDNIFMTRVMLAARRASHRPWRLYLRKVHAASTVTAAPTRRHLEGYRACLADVCALLARGGWDRDVALALEERKMVYLRQMHRLEGSARPLGERLRGLYICLRCRGLGYIVKRAMQLLCRRPRS